MLIQFSAITENGQYLCYAKRTGSARASRAIPIGDAFGSPPLFFERAIRRSCRFFRLASGGRHHVCRVRKFSRLRVSGPCPPILCSRSIGPHLTGPDSNGDVRNDASTQESFLAQTAVLSP